MISADGALAYTANYGTADAPGDTPSVIDIGGRAVAEEITIGDRPEQVAFVAHAADKKLSIIDVETGAVRAISWLAEAGPSYVAVQP